MLKNKCILTYIYRMVNNMCCFQGIMANPSWSLQTFWGWSKEVQKEGRGKNTFSGESRIQVWQKQPEENKKKDRNGKSSSYFTFSAILLYFSDELSLLKKAQMVKLPQRDECFSSQIVTVAAIIHEIL